LKTAVLVQNVHHKQPLRVEDNAWYNAITVCFAHTGQ